ncbi:putative DNA-binding protein escarola [Phtheirospermum japonicum]|uniref:Putative DNA-binding protein escarola n=1 Tax=Phtheirospermum japonicum TaxID=374723 RepID=A0A830C2N9_9LAMI|nr:putative DNA-binding protein escarola [Phtheirospermum japonicum]
MAGLDLGSANFISHQLHLQIQPESDDDSARKQFSGENNDNNSSGDLVARRPRGRPPGSKNKPKPPVHHHPRERQHPPGPHTGGRRRLRRLRGGRHLRAPAAAGDLRAQRHRHRQQRQPPAARRGGERPHAPRPLRDPVPVRLVPPAAGAPGATSLTIYLAGAQGQVVGGNVVGALIAAGPVIIIAASFTNVAYERLPLEEEEGLQMQPAAPPSSGGNGNPFPDPSITWAPLSQSSAAGE